MADARIEFELVSPEKLLFSEPVEMVVVPGEEGDFGVLPRHTPMISTVRPGVIRIYESGQVSQQIFVAGGFAEVTSARCTVLADEALGLDEIDRAKVEQDLKNAQEDLEDAKSDSDRASAERRIVVCQAKLTVTAA